MHSCCVFLLLGNDFIFSSCVIELGNNWVPVSEQRACVCVCVFGWISFTPLLLWIWFLFKEPLVESWALVLLCSQTTARQRLYQKFNARLNVDDWRIRKWQLYDCMPSHRRLWHFHLCYFFTFRKAAISRIQMHLTSYVSIIWHHNVLPQRRRPSQWPWRSCSLWLVRKLLIMFGNLRGFLHDRLAEVWNQLVYYARRRTG